MNDIKQAILEELSRDLKNDIERLEQTLLQVKDYKSSDDLKQEGKYDTRAIEAGYLASGQQQRLDELKEELQLLLSTEIDDCSAETPIALGTLVLLETNQTKKYYFLCSTSGGRVLNIRGELILVISVFSPLGKELIGLNAGDSFDLNAPTGIKNYNIVATF